MINISPLTKMEEELIKLNTKIFTPNVVQRLMHNYDGLQLKENDSFDPSNLSNEDLESLIVDITFFTQNPKTPLENISVNLANYYPKTESQEELVEYAKKLIIFDDYSKAAGLYLWGNTGVGKSHMAIAIAKEFMRKDQKPIFLDCSDYQSLVGLRSLLGSNQVWILDDANSGYNQTTSNLLKEICLNTHKIGGRIFITSNTEYSKLVNQCFNKGDPNLPRFQDRTKAMFKVINVVGESHRQETAWYNK